MSSMLGHDLSIALRRIARQGFYSAVSAIVLAIGIVTLLAAYVFVSYLRSYDSELASRGRAYVIAERVWSQTGADTPFMNGSAYPLADHLRADFPDLEKVARYSLWSVNVTAGANSGQRILAYAEPQFVEIFQLAPIAGDVRGALSEPRSVLLTKETAESLFGSADAVGKTLTLNGRENIDVTVRAVVAELPKTSHLARRGLFTNGFEVLASWDLFERLQTFPNFDSWGNMPVSTYVLLPADGSVSTADLDRRLAALAERNTPPQYFKFALRARPISEIATSTMQAAFQGYAGSGWRLSVLDALLLFAVTILVIACLNFVNLATAQSAARGLDIGTRKALGASFAQIVRQDLVQTALLVTAAIALALLALVPIARAFSGPYALALAIPWTEPRLWVFLGALLAGVTAAAGLYPALVLARVRPATALRGAAARSGPRGLRTLLVGLQFGTASFLAILVIVLGQQGDAIREAALGRFHDQYLSLFVPLQGGLDPDAFAAEIARSPRVRGVARANSPPFNSGSPPHSEYARSADDGAPRATVQMMWVGYDYFSVMEIPLLAGRVFSQDRADDVLPRDAKEFAARQGAPVRVVLDRDGARSFGWASPADAIGEILYTPGQSAQQYEVIGVVEHVTLNVRDPGLTGVAYFFAPRFTNVVLVRFDKNETAAVLADVDGAASRLGTGRPLAKMFLDQMFENAYWTFRLTNRVLAGLAMLAIAIAGIGLLGLASYVTSTRTREIGLRKTQGASPAQVVRLLLWDFSKPVVVANALAWPIAYYAAERYIGVFSEHVALTPLPFVAALAATVLLACGTVTVQAVRASRLRPVDALRRD